MAWAWAIRGFAALVTALAAIAAMAQERTTLRYGVLADFPPYQVWPADNVPGGADVDLARRLTTALGLGLQPVRYQRFADLEADLLAGRIDLASAMAVTPEREANLVFTRRYGLVPQAMVARASEPSIAMAPDLLGRSIAVVQGFASERKAAELFPLASRVPVATIEAGLRAVQSGRADTMLELKPAIVDVVERVRLDGLVIARTLETSSSSLHFALPRHRAAIAERLSAEIDRLAASEVDALVARWRAPAQRLDVSGAASLDEPASQALAAAFAQPVIGVVRRDDRPFTWAAPDGAPTGMSVDLVQRLTRSLGGGTPQWRWLGSDEAPAALRDGSVDLVVGLDQTSEPASGAGVRLRFVGPFLEYPMVLIGPPQGAAFSLDELYRQRLALPPGHVARPLIDSRHPSITVVDCLNVQDCIDTVTRGRADATMTDVVSAANALAERSRGSVQMVGTESALRRGHSIAVADRHAALLPAINGSLQRAVATELPDLKARWLTRRTPADVARTLLLQWAPWVGLLLALAAVAWWLHARALRAEVRRTRDAQRAAEAARAAGQRFTSFMAHEVRNSLHSVIAGTQLIGEPRADLPRLAAALGESARGTLLLLNNLLERDRLQAGRLGLHLQPARLGDGLDAVVRELRPSALGKGLELVFDGPVTEPASEPQPVLMIDALRIQQVVRNLLANAIKYSQRGRVTLTARIGASSSGDPARRRVAIAVDDQGPGIPHEMQQAVFDPYVMVEGAGVLGSGTGLGLALCRDLARLMRGDLSLRSEPGRGTTIDFVFDAWVVAADEVPAAVRERMPSSARRVLLVEDAEPYALALEAALRREGVEVRRAASLNAAVVALRDQAFDGVLADLHLPDGESREMAERAAGMLPAGGRSLPPLVLMSAELGDADVDTLRAEGAVEVLAKTADVASLAREALTALDRVVAGRPAPAEGQPSSQASAA